MGGMANRDDYTATDFVISLAKSDYGREGWLSCRWDYGIGLHLGLCLLKEQAHDGAKI